MCAKKQLQLAYPQNTMIPMWQLLSKRKEYIFLVAILLVGFFFRTYKLPFMVGFDYDQEYTAIFASNVLTSHHIPAIGQQLSVQDLFMGPFYFYYLVPFYALAYLNPLGGYYGSIFLGIGICALYFFVFKQIFGTPAGLIAACFRAVLLEKIQSDWSVAPTYSSGIIILITWFCFYKYWQGKSNYFPLLSFLFGMYTSFHPILFPFYFVFLLLLVVKRRLPTLRQFLLSIVTFILPILPLLIFEYHRHFMEIKTLLSLHASNTHEVKTISTLFQYLLIVLRYPSTTFGITLPTEMLTTLFCLLFYAIIFFIIIKGIGFWKDRFHIFMLFGTTIIFLLYYYLLPIHAPEYYFRGIETVLFIYVCATLGMFWKGHIRYAVSIGIALVFALNFFQLFSLWQHPGIISLADKSYVLQHIKTAQGSDKAYQIIYNVDAGQQYGLGYLQRYDKLKMVGKPHTTYEIVIPAGRTTAKPDIISPSGKVVVLIHKD